MKLVHKRYLFIFFTLFIPFSNTIASELQINQKEECEKNIEPKFRKTDLIFDAYTLLQKNNYLSYYNIPLLRASMPWECAGLTHKYWACKEPKKESQLKTIWIDDIDGGRKSDKFESDIKLLTQGLKDEPENERYMFYLAQSYKSIGQLEEAIRWYKMRIQKGGSKEEIWYSQLMLGETYEILQFWDQALHWYLTAYEYNPERAEPLQKIALHYQNEGKNELAYLFAKYGSLIPYPKNQSLFISDPVYDYQFDEEISIAAYYTAYRDEGIEASDRLLFKKKIPKHIKEQTHINLLFYVQNLKNERIKLIHFDFPWLYEGATEKFYPSNPTIQKTPNGYDVICRTVNYRQKEGMEYVSRNDRDPTIRTRNFLLHYDKKFNLMSQKEIIEQSKQEKKSNVVGLEDCRLITLENNSWFLATTYDTHPNAIGQTLCKFVASNDMLQVEKMLPLKNLTTCEKNWLPFVKNNELYIIYGYDPFKIYKVDQTTGAYKIAIQYESLHDFSYFRGSAAPIKFDDGYLLLVHEVIFDTRRYYIHRFVYLDKDFKIERISRPFTFLHSGIEYCCGMTIDHTEKQCVMAISYEDRKAYLIFVDLNTVRSLLKSLP